MTFPIDFIEDLLEYRVIIDDYVSDIRDSVEVAWVIEEIPYENNHMQVIFYCNDEYYSLGYFERDGERIYLRKSGSGDVICNRVKGGIIRK